MDSKRYSSKVSPRQNSSPVKKQTRYTYANKYPPCLGIRPKVQQYVIVFWGLTLILNIFMVLSKLSFQINYILQTIYLFSEFIHLMWKTSLLYLLFHLIFSLKILNFITAKYSKTHTYHVPIPATPTHTIHIHTFPFHNNIPKTGVFS